MLARVLSVLLLGLLVGMPVTAVELDRATLIRSDAERPPDIAAGESVMLPDDWRTRRPGEGGFAWYRLEVARPESSAELWAVYLPSVNMNAEVWINGQPVGSGGRFTRPVAQNFNRPLYFSFPGKLLERASNRVDVRFFAYPYHWGRLGPIQVGPDRDLRPVYERQLLVQTRFAQFSTGLVVVMVLFMGGLWIGTRFDSLYGTAALAGLFWGVASLNYWVRDLPVPVWTWERIIHSAVDWFPIGLALWSHRLLGLARPRLERALFGYGLLAMSFAWLIPAQHFYPAINGTHAISLGVAGYATGIVLYRLRDLPPSEAVIYLVGCVAGIGFAAHDLAIQVGWLGHESPHLIAYVVPFLLVAFGATLIRRFIASYTRTEELNERLAQRLETQGAALESERLLGAERERIMREMHDGLGGHLVATLSMVETGAASSDEVTRALRIALDDMRLVVDSLDPEVDGLAELLGLWRARADPFITRSGLRFAWNVSPFPPVALGGEQSLHVLRILQETVTNIVKHAGATQIAVSCGSGDGSAYVEVCDDGRGIVDAPSAGRGLRNMRARAQALGGRLEVKRGDPGTRVTLWLPAVSAESAGN